MKRHTCILGLLLFASVASAENYEINLDWSKEGTLREVVVQQCDDSNYENVEITIPGKPDKNFRISMNVDITSGRSLAGCSVKKLQSGSNTKYLFNAVDGGCVIKVNKVRSSLSVKPQSATYEVHDAC